MARPAGSLNKATIEKKIIAKRMIDRARELNEPLAKEKMGELLTVAMAAMAQHQPVSKEMVERERALGNSGAKERKGSWRLFGEWFDRAAYVCRSLAPFQSPRLQAIAIAAPPPPQDPQNPERDDDVVLTVFEGGRVVKQVRRDGS